MNDSKKDCFIQIPMDFFETLCSARIPAEARQMLDVIIRKTIGFHKTEDSIPTKQFMKITSLSRNAIYKARQKLVEMNIITICKKADSQVRIYSVQSDPRQWKLSPKKQTVTI